MRFALIDENRFEAKPGLNALCPCCSRPVIAKCGTQRLHHWAHRSAHKCDDWWEPETDWHRAWKSNFPEDWQECILPDGQTGEKHIADVCTDYGLVIEFQHSHIEPKERVARENFYRNMVWVVDGTRLKRDHDRFFKKEKSFAYIKKDIYQVPNPDECFPAGWLTCSSPVIFDFGTTYTGQFRTIRKDNLYCLFPVRIGGNAVIAEISRTAFINTTNNGEWLIRLDAFMDVLSQARQAHENQVAQWRQQLPTVTYIRVPRPVTYVKFQRPVRFTKRRRFLI